MSVVVTGIGTLGAFGIGLGALRAALARGAAPLTPVDRSGGFHRKGGARSAALCTGLDLTPWVTAAQSRRMSAASRMAVAAAHMAVAESPLAAGETSVDIATAFGPAQFTERLVREFQQGDPQLCSPFLFTDCVANAPAGQIALALAAKGANTTWCQREAGQVLALLGAVAQLRRGAARALCGVVDEMPPVVHAILDRFGVLARAGQDGRELARPFAAGRTGFVAGEGATVLALAPAGPGLVRVLGGGRAFDPGAGPATFGADAAGIAQAFRTRLGEAGVALASLDAVVASASGSPAGDRYEAEVLAHLFGRALPPLLVPKAVVGEYGGGVLATAVVALQGAEFALPAGFGSVDPGLGLCPFAGPLLANRVLVTQFAVGGACAFAVLEAA